MNTTSPSTKIQMLIRKPVADVFGAFIDPAITSQFWFTHGSSKLQKGKNITWTWEMYQLSIPVTVLEIIENQLIKIEWGTNQDKSKVKWEFKSIGESKTYLTITSYDFPTSGEKLNRQLRDSTEGFSLVIAGLKAWLEHGVNLNLVADKHPKELM